LSVTCYLKIRSFNMKKSVFTLLAVIALSLTGLSLTGCPTDTDTPSTGGKTLASIAVTTPPTKTRYNLNEELDTAGMVVTATYSDQSTAAVTGYTTTGYDKTTTGSKTVTVTYQSKTAAFTVTVIDPSLQTAAAPTATPAAGASGATVTLAATNPSPSLLPLPLACFAPLRPWRD
jgi:hypothetical protein